MSKYDHVITNLLKIGMFSRVSEDKSISYSIVSEILEKQ